MSATITTAADKLRCAERELKQHLHVYPRRIVAGKMTQTFADREIAVMRAIVEDYRRDTARDDLFGGVS